MHARITAVTSGQASDQKEFKRMMRKIEEEAL